MDRGMLERLECIIHLCVALRLHRARPFLKYLFNFWLGWVLIAACGLSLVEVSRDYSLIVALRLLIAEQGL